MLKVVVKATDIMILFGFYLLVIFYYCSLFTTLLYIRPGLGNQQRLISRDSAQTLVYVIFDTKGNPFVNLCIDKWYLFYLFYKPSLELCIPFDCCKWTVFKTWINKKTERFLEDFTVKKWIYHPFGEMSDFPSLSHTLWSTFNCLNC